MGFARSKSVSEITSLCDGAERLSPSICLIVLHALASLSVPTAPPLILGSEGHGCLGSHLPRPPHVMGSLPLSRIGVPTHGSNEVWLRSLVNPCPVDATSRPGEKLEGQRKACFLPRTIGYFVGIGLFCWDF